MGINWIKVEDEMPVDKGKIQKFLVCTKGATPRKGSTAIVRYV